MRTNTVQVPARYGTLPAMAPAARSTGWLPLYATPATGKRTGRAAALGVLLAVAGCATSSPETTGPQATRPAMYDHARTGSADPSVPHGRASRPLTFRQMGTGQFVNQNARFVPEVSVRPVDDNTYSVNLVGVPVDQAAKAILGDTLKLTYSITPDVAGTITLLTSSPLGHDDLLETFNTVLQLNGLALKLEGDVYVIEDVTANLGMPGFRLGTPSGPADNAVYVLPLDFISAAEMIRILEPIAAPSVKLWSNRQRNILFAAGSGPDIQSVLGAVNLFDVDVFEGKSMSLVKLRSVDPAEVAQELTVAFDTMEGGSLEGRLRFLPNEALGSILIIASQPNYIRRAEVWLEAYEAAAAGDGHSAVVYQLENRTAVELTPVLTELLSFGSSTALQTDGLADGDATTPYQSADETMAGPARLVADDVSNTIIAYATAPQHEEIGRLLKRLDSVANQVLLEATIAEVVLTDELAFGVRWFFQSGNFDVNFTGLEQSTVLPRAVLPGFNALFAANKVRVAIDALASVTDLNIISSPSLLVLDNREAVLRVGDQVPIATRSLVKASDPDAPIVNAITQEDTGVILKIRPRVGASGRIILEIDQEVSDVAVTDSSGIDSPTIEQRIITTTVAVDNGQSVALGGLIRESRSRRRDKVPVLGDIPVIGAAFRNTKDEDRRTELLVIITPKLIRDAAQARRATQEFRDKLTAPSDLIEFAPRPLHHSFKRILF